MKQSSLPAKIQSLLILIVVVLMLSASGCVKLAQRGSAEVQYQLDTSRQVRGSAININIATPEELESLPGIGKAIAERIVTHRQQYGAFRRTEHLMMVRGISDRKFREIRPLIGVE